MKRDIALAIRVRRQVTRIPTLIFIELYRLLILRRAIGGRFACLLLRRQKRLLNTLLALIVMVHLSSWACRRTLGAKLRMDYLVWICNIIDGRCRSQRAALV